MRWFFLLGTLALVGCSNEAERGKNAKDAPDRPRMADVRPKPPEKPKAPEKPKDKDAEKPKPGDAPKADPKEKDAPTKDKETPAKDKSKEK